MFCKVTALRSDTIIFSFGGLYVQYVCLEGLGPPRMKVTNLDPSNLGASKPGFYKGTNCGQNSGMGLTDNNANRINPSSHLPYK